MTERSRTAVGPVAYVPSASFLKAQKALDQAARLQRSGDLAGAIAACKEGIAFVVNSEEIQAVRLRVRLRVQQEDVSRMYRASLRAA